MSGPCGLDQEEVEALLSEAEHRFPDSDFVASVKEWFEEMGYITEDQEAVLFRIANGPWRVRNDR